MNMEIISAPPPCITILHKDLSFLDEGEWARIYVQRGSEGPIAVVKCPKDDGEAYIQAEMHILEAMRAHLLRAAALSPALLHAPLVSGEVEHLSAALGAQCSDIRGHLALLQGCTMEGYLAMDYCKGQPLDTILANHNRVTPTMAHHILLQVCNVLEWLQRQFEGFRHADLHCGNVLVDIVATAGPSGTAPLNVAESESRMVNVAIIDFACAGQVHVPKASLELPRLDDELFGAVATDVLRLVESMICYAGWPYGSESAEGGEVDVHINDDTHQWLAQLAAQLSTMTAETFRKRKVHDPHVHTRINTAFASFREVKDIIERSDPLASIQQTIIESRDTRSISADDGDSCSTLSNDACSLLSNAVYSPLLNEATLDIQLQLQLLTLDSSL